MRYTAAPLTVALAAACSTGRMRRIIPTDWVGRVAVSPPKVCPGLTVSAHGGHAHARALTGGSLEITVRLPSRAKASTAIPPPQQAALTGPR